MKLVDLRELTSYTSPKYVGIPQPMKVLHSTEEFKNEVKNKRYWLIRNMGDFHEFLKEYNLISTRTFAEVAKISDCNVWLSTGEKAIPDVYTQDGMILWKLDEKNNIIPTDNCYIQLFIIYSAGHNYFLYTSSGVFNVSMSKWELSAAVKPQFNRPETKIQAGLRGKKREENLERLLNKKKHTVRNTRLFYLLFSQDSPYFLKPDEAIKAVYGNDIRTKEREKLLKSLNFQNTFMKELSYLMPSLQKAFQENIKDEKMVEMALDIFNVTKKNATEGKATTAEMIDSYDLIYRIRQSDDEVSQTNSVKLVGDSNEQGKIPAKPQTKVIDDKAGDIQIFDDTDVDVKLNPNAKIENQESDKESKETELKFLREETDALNYVNNDKL